MNATHIIHDRSCTRITTNSASAIAETICDRPPHRIFCSRVYSLLAFSLSIIVTPFLAAAEIPMSGSGWPALNGAVDSLVRENMAEEKIPGMTVAVSVKGRQVYRKGFGYARQSTKLIPMGPDHRAMIGSVSKALITGPAGNQLLLKKNVNPKTTKLYGLSGPGSVFGQKFNKDISFGVKRFWPIAASAVSADNKVYTWYMNGTYSIGTGEKLDYHQAPRAFSLPPKLHTPDIVGIAISANNRVHTWYINGTHSVGRANDLDSRTPIDSDEPAKTKLPNGAGGFKNVAAIAIGKSSNRIYAWYLDGTYSVGTTSDLGAHAGRRPFTMSGGTPYQIRAIGIAPNRRVYTLLSNGKRTKGTVAKLDATSGIAPYTIPGISFGPPRYSAGKWFRDITPQHLLDHKAGFWGSGGSDGASKMFKVPKDQLTYEQVHRYFLRTRPLLDPPGESYRYSNHGFGLWTLIIERYSGKSYKRYVIDEYLKPIGVESLVKPLSTNKDKYDACPHRYVNGSPRKRLHWNSRLGLAAGGWTASATSVLRITRHLNQTYSQKQLDDFGWGKSDRGRLSHSGLVPDGGASFVAMYPIGYKVSGTGGDLSEVHIAVAANIDTNTTELKRLVSNIAVQVAKHNYPANYDLFKVKYPGVTYTNFSCL